MTAQAQLAELDESLFAKKGDAAPAQMSGPAPAKRRRNNVTALESAETSEHASPAEALAPLGQEGDEQACLTRCAPLQSFFPEPDAGAIIAPLQDDSVTPHPVEESEPQSDPEPDVVPLAAAPPRQDSSLSTPLLLLVGLVALAAIAWLFWSNGTATDQPVAAVESKAPVETPPGEAAPASEAKPDATDAANPTAAAAADQPTFDVIRVEESGEALLAGRATPNSHLVILDQGQPIGTVQADAGGEWLLIPEAPLIPGEHDFSIAVKADDSHVTLPEPAAKDATEDPTPAVEPTEGEAPPSSAVPTDDESSDASGAAEPDAADATSSPATEAPIPTRKPDIQSLLGAEEKLGSQAIPASYEVQIASVGSAEDAKQEIVRLQRRFSDLLEQHDLRVEQGSAAETEKLFRIRTGPFTDQSEAREICARFEAKRQDCLVVRR